MKADVAALPARFDKTRSSAEKPDQVRDERQTAEEAAPSRRDQQATGERCRAKPPRPALHEVLRLAQAPRQAPALRVDHLAVKIGLRDNEALA
jgi:hypothetical protein